MNTADEPLYIVRRPFRGYLLLTVPAPSGAEAARRIDAGHPDAFSVGDCITWTGKAVAEPRDVTP